MATPKGSRRGSLQFWPRVRSSRIYPRISFWKKEDLLSGFCAYKAGMVQYRATETRKNVNHGKEIVKAATVLEIPPVYAIAIVFYRNKRKCGELFNIKELSKIFKKDLKRKINFKEEETGKIPEKFDELRIKAATFPRKTNLKKTPEVIELGCSLEVEKAKELFGKEINIDDYFSEGEYVDITAVSKGKGTQGVIKRFGCKLRSHKAKKGRRKVGSLGGVIPRKIDWRVPREGQMGFGQRTEFNKLILKISDKLDEVNPKQGFKEYGLVNTKYLLLEGSVSGPRKRLIVLRKPKKSKKEVLQVTEILK